MHLLIVEDEPQIRELLKDLLSMEGHQVTTCGNGQEGWERFNHSPGEYNLVIADMRMPVLDGLGLLKRLRGGGHAVPCILMTGHADIADDSDGLPASTEVLYKPFDMGEVLRLVSHLGTKS